MVVCFLHTTHYLGVQIIPFYCYLFEIRLLNIDDPIKRNMVDSLAGVMWYVRNLQCDGLELAENEQH